MPRGIRIGVCYNMFNFGKKLQTFNSGVFSVSIEVIEFLIQKVKNMLNGY